MLDLVKIAIFWNIVQKLIQILYVLYTLSTTSKINHTKLVKLLWQMINGQSVVAWKFSNFSTTHLDHATIFCRWTEKDKWEISFKHVAFNHCFNERTKKWELIKQIWTWSFGVFCLAFYGKANFEQWKISGFYTVQLVVLVEKLTSKRYFLFI